MQKYGALFARVYNERWAGFANQVAPLIRALYEETFQRSDRTLLDLCCGTGQMARRFLEAGYRVVGLDLSADMLEHARANATKYAEIGQARFVQGDAADFRLEESFGLIVSTYDALNHLPDAAALRGCFASVRRALSTDGVFVFDLNTRYGLNRWNTITITEDDDLTLINRGIYGGGERAYTRITGFVRDDNTGQYSRFAETFFNVAYDLADVQGWLKAAGFADVYIAQGSELYAPAADPESLGRAWFVAR